MYKLPYIKMKIVHLSQVMVDHYTNSRFKLDSGAHGNLIPKSMFQRLYPGLPHSELRKSIDKQVTLVAYNKQEIKQLGSVLC